MAVLFFAWLKRQYQRVGTVGILHDLVLVALLLTVAVLLIERHFNPRSPAPAPKVTTLPAVPGVTTTTVNDATITPKTVTKVVSDPAQAALVKMLLAENATLKASATTATVATAESESHGGGAIVPAQAVAERPTGLDAAAVTPVHFADYRLDFTSDGKTADYTLRQKFRVVSTTGRRADGSPLSLVRLYEQTPSGAVEVPVTETTGLVADQTAPHWILHVGVQAGLAFSVPTTGGGGLRNGIIGLQWLSRGKTRAAEDERFTLLEPALMTGGGVTEFGLVPFAVNIGLLPHQPLTNLWFGPYISSSRVGGVVVVKF
jgi:hypothetical protein